MEILNISKLKKELAHGVLFEDLNLIVNSKDKIGIVGKNGVGKSTLLKMIIGEENITAGTISGKKGLKIGYYQQNLQSSKKVCDIIVDDCQELIKIKKKLQSYEEKMANEEIINFDQYLLLQDIFSNKNGYELDGVINKICMELKIGQELMNKNFNVLSGGQQARVLLAKVLIGQPDLFLLDEPLNHLDMQMICWLEEYLRKVKKTMLIVSHDRYFLDSVVTTIIEINKNKINTYVGNYTFYQKEKIKNREKHNSLYQRQQNEIKKLENSAKQLKQWAIQGDNESLHKASKNITKRIEKMDKVEKITEETMHLNLSVQSKKNYVVRFKDYTLEKYNLVFFQGLSFSILGGDKIIITGDNGCGKSLLLNKIVNDEDNEKIIKNKNLKYAKIDQHIVFNDGKKSILDYFQTKTGLNNTSARAHLAKYLFKGEDVFKLVGKLSGGEAVRLELSILSTNDNDVIILDEPTNNMDINSREKLEEVLIDFQGTLIIVSHDRYFIKKVSKKIYKCIDKKLIEVDSF